MRSALALLCLAWIWPGLALGWGADLHALVDWQARRDARAAGQAGGPVLTGLDLQAYLAGAPGPDLWYTAGYAGVTIPPGIEEDGEYVRLLVARSLTVRELSFALGYHGHILGDGPGHRIYISPHGDAARHLVRDASLAFSLLGEHEGYPQLSCPLELLLGWGLDAEPGAWSWGTFDDGLLALMQRAADDWCAARGGGEGCPVTLETLGKLRAQMLAANNDAVSALTFPFAWGDDRRTLELAQMVRALDEAEFGPGQGPALLSEAVAASAEEVRLGVFSDEVRAWLEASDAPAAEVQRLLEGPPPDGQDELEHPGGQDADAGCASAGQAVGQGLALGLLALGLLGRGRRGP
ncbi:MAG TPA: zinc dependent phospholipase C family protein [Myxococcota bacterium]|nr:zinc dependent phospholipase C family protein [Myxococcota bacterium]HRY94504.1 zinc dependent phospholipase C family protein [Myxococcota bacterium]HSA21573.1 zinc dependent phospholipase C family protein [Myxococcota bacterium]